MGPERVPPGLTSYLPGIIFKAKLLSVILLTKNSRPPQYTCGNSDRKNDSNSDAVIPFDGFENSLLNLNSFLIINSLRYPSRFQRGISILRHPAKSSKLSPSFGIAVAGMFAMAAGMGIGRFVYTPILPFMESGLALSKTESGLIASMNFAGYLLGAWAAARQSSRRSRRYWLLSSLIVSSFTTAAMALTSSVPIFLILRFFGGGGSAYMLVFGSALILDSLAQQKKLALSAIHFAGVGLGISFSAIVVAGLAKAGFGWRGFWLASGFLSTILTIMVYILIPSDKSSSGSSLLRTPAIFDRRLISLIAAYGLFGFGYVITATFLSVLVRASPNLAPVEPYIWLIFGLAAIPSVAIWTSLAEKIGSHRSFAVACLVQGIGVSASVLIDEIFSVVLTAILLGGTFMGITALGFMEARRLTKSDPRIILGYMTLAFGTGQMIGPTLAGLAYGIDNSFYYPSLLAALCLILAAWLSTNPGTVDP